MLAKEPEEPYAGPGRRPHRGAAGGARPEPARRGVWRRGGGAAEGPGPRPSRLPRGCENRPGAGVGAGTKFPETRAARVPGRRVPPAAPRGRVSAKSRPPPGPCPGPRPPTGSAPRRLILRPPARLPASAGCPPRAPLLLPSARARGGPRARSLRPTALSRGGGGPLGAGEGPPRERRATGWGEAGEGRAERRAARVRTAPSAAARSCGAHPAFSWMSLGSGVFWSLLLCFTTYDPYRRLLGVGAGAQGWCTGVISGCERVKGKETIQI